MMGLRFRHVPSLLGFLAALCACAHEPAGDFQPDLNRSGQERIALLVGIDDYDFPAGATTSATSEIKDAADLLTSLDFPASSACILEGCAATLSALRRALAEFAAAGGAESSRLLYLATLGGIVLDRSGDEPDESDETLVLFDANGTGAGELLDDELAEEAGPPVELVDANGDFEISGTTENRLVLRGPDNRVRNRLDSVADVPDVLRGHVCQHRVPGLRGNGSPLLEDHETIRVDIRPMPDQLPCATGAWDRATTGAVQDTPLCYQWHIRTSLAGGSPPLYVSVLGYLIGDILDVTCTETICRAHEGNST